MSALITPNPYTNRAAVTTPEHFFGRENELRDVFTRIQGGQSVMIIGERRIGKSSLLNAIGFELAEFLGDTFRFAFLDMQSIAGCTEDSFVQNLLSRIQAATGVSSTLQGPAALKDIAPKIRTAKLKLIVALDEFDVLVWNDNISTEFLVFLRSWTASNSFPFVVAFREGSIDRIVDDQKFGSAFLNLFGSIYVGPLKEHEARDLVRIPANEGGITFTDAEAAFVLDIAGYFPLFIQIACYHLFEAKRAPTPPANFEQYVSRHFKFEVAPYFEYLWQRLDAKYRDALNAWIQAGGTADVSAEEELLKRGLLIEDRRALRVFSKLLGPMVAGWERQPRNFAQTVRDALLG